MSTLGQYTPDNLIAGDYPLKAVDITVKSGQSLERGALLGQITADQKYILSLAAASDGSETPVAILCDDVDASGGDKTATAYIKGQFNHNAVTFGTGHTFDSTKEALAQKGILLYDAVQA